LRCSTIWPKRCPALSVLSKRDIVSYKEFRLLRAEKDFKHNELLRQALNAYLKANGRDPIA